MRVAGRQKGSKVKPYTHVVVQPSAPKSRYTFSYHSSESSAKAAQKKTEVVGVFFSLIAPGRNHTQALSASSVLDHLKVLGA